MRKILLSLSFLILIILPRANAQWTFTGGPEGSLQIYDITQADTFLVALTDCGVYKLPQKSSRWELISEKRYKMAAGFNKALVVSNGKELRQVDLSSHYFGINVLNSAHVSVLTSYRDTVLLVGDRRKGFMYSSHAGLQMHYHLAGLPVDTLVQPSGTELIFKVNSIGPSSSYVFLASDSGVFRTDWSFAPWEKKSAGLPAREIEFVAQHQHIAYASFSDSLYRSLDSGETWQFIYQAPSDFKGAVVGHEMGLYVNTMGQGVLRSLDSGQTWTPFNTGLQQPQVNFLKNFQMGLIACTASGGYYFEEQNQWTQGGQQGMVCSTRGQLTAGSGVLVHSAPSKVSRMYADSVWEDITPSIPLDLRFGGVLYHRDTLYLAAVEYLDAFDRYKLRPYYSLDNGDTWIPFNKNIEYYSIYEDLPQVAAGSDNIYFFSPRMFYFTSDFGRTFTNATNFLPFCNEFSDILVHKDTVIISTCMNNRLYVDLKSVDVPATRPLALGVMTANDSIILLDRMDSLLISYDMGQSWQFHAEKSEKTYFYDMLLTDSLLYAVSRTGVYASRDLGKSWVSMSNNLPKTQCRQIVGFRDTLYTSVASDGVYKYLPENVFNLPVYEAGPQVSIYPNPAVDEIFVHFHEEVQKDFQYQVFNTAGVKIAGGNAEDGKIQVQNLKPGVYILILENGRDSWSQKVVLR